MDLIDHSLNQQILVAHDQHNGVALAALYSRAAQAHEKPGQIEEACYFYTQAYVFALQEGLSDAKIIHAKLKQFGSEE